LGFFVAAYGAKPPAICPVLFALCKGCFRRFPNGVDWPINGVWRLPNGV
jgi:hypothetical protein